MDADARDVHCFFQANFLPGFASILGSPHAVTVGNVAPDGFFTATYINDVVVVFRYGYGANRAAKKAVGDVLPGLAAVFGTPNAAAYTTEIK